MKTSLFKPKEYSYLWYHFTWKGIGIILIWVLLGTFTFINVQKEGSATLSFLGFFLMLLLIIFNWHKRYKNKIWPFV